MNLHTWHDDTIAAATENLCRYRLVDPAHRCERRDGRLIPNGDPTPCFLEASKQVYEERRQRTAAL